MKNTTKAVSFIASVFILIGVMIASCISLNHNLRYTTASSRTKAPVDAFVLVDVTHVTRPDTCTSTNPDVTCESIIKSLPPITTGSSGSGMLVLSSEGPVILTAGHVCKNTRPDPVFAYAGVTITVAITTIIKVHSPIKGTYATTIIKIDNDKDLCMLLPEEVFTSPVPIADSEPKVGDIVYAIAAPFGISGENLSLIFNGFFSGTDKNKRFYTIPTRPGSSGAAVLNEDWEVVGMLHTAFRDLESVGIGTGLADIRTFLFSADD